MTVLQVTVDVEEPMVGVAMNASCDVTNDNSPLALHGADFIWYSSIPNDTVCRWVRIGNGKVYTPKQADNAKLLKVEVSLKDTLTRTRLSGSIVTKAVVEPEARPMIRSNDWINSLKYHSPEDIDLKILSYNVLSDLIVRGNSYNYSFCPKWALDWHYRKRNMLREINERDADLICLQEVQSDHFKQFFDPALKEKGYTGLYKPRVTMYYTIDGEIHDGCAIFYRRSKFELLQTHKLDFANLPVPIDHSHEALRRDLNKDQVAIIVVLEILEKGQKTGHQICLSTTHLAAGCNIEVKLRQAVQLLTRIHDITKSSNMPVLICGDFNSTTDSPVYKYVVADTSTYPTHGLKVNNDLNLASAYDLATVKGNEQPTYYSRTYTGTLDYIFYTANKFTVQSVLGTLRDCPIPSAHWSSDHFSLFANLRLLKGRKQLESGSSN